MKIKKVPIQDLKYYPGNPRKISDAEIEKLKTSIKEFGIVQPLIINQRNEVIGGNQRLKALVDLGLDTADCIEINLPKEKEKALNLALNRISGEWDESLLRQFIADLDEETIHITGFDDVEIEELQITDDFDLNEPGGFTSRLGDFKDKFDITFTFPIEKKEIVLDCLKKKGKEHYLTLLLNDMEKVNHA